MNQKRKRLGLWILFLAALLLTQFTVPVKASEPQIQDVNIQMVGGQIRTIDPMGLRMVACIKKSYIQELEKSGATVSYGIVLLPKKYLTEGQALTLHLFFVNLIYTKISCSFRKMCSCYSKFL